jgi:hypothetical protein
MPPSMSAGLVRGVIVSPSRSSNLRGSPGTVRERRSAPNRTAY